MPAKSIDEVFTTQNPTLKVDSAFIQELRHYIASFMSKNEEHTKFFGNVLVGVNKVVYTDADKNEFYNSILEMDKIEARKEYRDYLLSVDRKKYDPEYLKVAGDTTNAAIIWLCYKIRNSKSIKDKEKDIGITYCLILLQIKFLTSLLNSYYPHPVDEALAISAYNKLSRRFILRRHNSWKEVLIYRAKMFFLADRDGNVKVNNVFDKLTPLQDVLDVITGVQTAVRRSLVEYNKVFYDVKDEDERLLSSSALGLTGEGEVTLVDKISVVNNLKNYLTRIVSNEADFIKDELVSYVTKEMSGTTFKALHKSLRFLTQNYGERKNERLTQFVDDSLIFGLDYIRRNDIDTKDLVTTFKKLQGALSSGRSLDQDLLNLRVLGDEVIERALHKKMYSSTITATRTATSLYIHMRTLTMKHYS